MDDFIYISNTKVDMLVPQLSAQDKTKVAAELGINIAVLEADYKPQRETEKNDNLFFRLKAVSNHILKSEKVGAIDCPDIWIQDAQDVKIIFLPENENIVFFIGETKNGTRFALGGSRAHIISQCDPERIVIGWPFLTDLLHSMRIMIISTENPQIPQPRSDSFVRSIAKEDEFEWLDFIKVSLRSSQGPSVKIKFLAKRLLEGEHPDDKTPSILATPLYVAGAD